MENHFKQPLEIKNVPIWLNGISWILLITSYFYLQNHWMRWVFIIYSMANISTSVIWLALFNDITVSESGLDIRLFQIKWKLLSWEQVVGVVDLSIPPPIIRFTIRRYKHNEDKGPWSYIQIKKLTFVHQIARFIGVNNMYPGILIPPKMLAREKLLTRIRTRIRS